MSLQIALRFADQTPVNYFELHLGDYAKDTEHLSALEHGIYGLLMRRYYSTELPIPDRDAIRIAKAPRKHVERILAEFFQRHGDVWKHKRIEAEIARFKDKQTKAKRSAAARWSHGDSHSEPDANAMRTQCEGNALQAPSTNQKQELPASPGAGAPAELLQPDPIFGTGLALLVRKGTPERQARGVLGKLRKAVGDFEAIALLAEAEGQDVSDPVAWLSAAAVHRARAGPVAFVPKTVAAYNAMGAAIEQLRTKPEQPTAELVHDRDCDGTSVAARAGT